jgi:hypothetical protein
MVTARSVVCMVTARLVRYKSSTHYLGDKNRFDVSSKGPSSGISVELLLPSDVDIRYVHWPRIEVGQIQATSFR